MRLNSRGQAVAGRTTVHVDGVVPPALLGVVAGNPQWLTDTTIVCQALVGDYRLVTLDVTDPHAQLQVVDPRGQTHLFAGAGVWARHLNGYLDSLGMVDPEAAPVAVDNTSGHVAVAAGRGSRLEVWAPTLITYIGPPPDSWEPNDIHYRDGLLAFRRDGYGETYPQRRMARVKGQGIRVAGGAVLTYQHGRGLVIHWDASLVGIALHLDPKDGEQDFSPDMIARPDGTLLVKSCRGEGELPNELREYAIDLVRYTVNGESRPVEDLSVPRVPVEPEPGPGPNPEPNPEPDPMKARGYLKTVTSYLCVDPAFPEQVQERSAGGAWEEVEVLAIPGMGYTIRFLAANVFFCLTPDSEFQTRKSAGAWETFVVAEQPYDWKHRFVFRSGDDGRVVDVLFFEARA